MACLVLEISSLLPCPELCLVLMPSWRWQEASDAQIKRAYRKMSIK